MIRCTSDSPPFTPSHAVKRRHEFPRLPPLPAFKPEDGPTSFLDGTFWGLWRFGIKEGRVQTLGCDAAGNPLAGRRPHLLSLSQASELAAALDRGGVGVIADAVPGLLGVTLTGCVDTSGRISPAGERFLAAAPGYAEVSPTGLGITVIAKAVGANAHGFRRGGLRAYRLDEVIPITGWRYPGRPSDVANLALDLSALAEAVLP